MIPTESNKLYKQSSSKSVRSQFFVNRVINVWNNLPQVAVLTCSSVLLKIWIFPNI